MKFALITGASGGVARALASRLRESGWKLVLVSRDVTLLDPADGDVLVQADVSTPGGAEAAFALAAERAGIVPDALINCAGNTLIAPLGRVTAEALRGCMAANVDTAFFSVQAYTKALAAARKTGDIVLFSSVVAGLERADVDDHVDLASAFADRPARLQRLDLRRSGPQRKADHGADDGLGAAQASRATLHVDRVHTHGREAVLLGFVAQRVDLLVGRVRLQERVVDELRHVLRHGADAEAAGDAAAGAHQRAHLARAFRHAMTAAGARGTGGTAAFPTAAEQRRVLREHLSDGVHQRLVIAVGRDHGQSLHG